MITKQTRDCYALVDNFTPCPISSFTLSVNCDFNISGF